jgi:Icc-related predicted phosphoesterase
VLEIVIIGDVHDHRQRLAGVLQMLHERKPTVALMAGDVGLDPPWLPPAREAERAAHDQSVRRVFRRVSDALSCPVVFVPGNHDLPRPVEDSGGLNCDGRRIELAGLSIAGFGGAGPALYGFPYEWEEAQARAGLERLLARSREPTEILLCHTPPVGTKLDRAAHGQHVGSAAVREWIGNAQPGLFVCGHIHEAWGVELLDGVPCLNAGALGEPYGQEIVWCVGWDAGGPAWIRSLRQLPGAGIESRDWL